MVKMPMRWIYISPHLDDAVLSAGGLIYEQTRAGMDVDIWTLLCGFPPTEELSPFAQLLHQRWGIPTAAEATTARRAEDAKAAKIVGAKTVHFDFLDCIYRRGTNGSWLYSDIFVPPHEEDKNLPAQMAESISARLKPTDQLVCQLGLGSHIDHVLVRRAVELLQRPILYYADIPYLFNSPAELVSKTARLKATSHRIADSGVVSWQDAIAAYKSQISSLFDSPDAMQAQIQQYWSEFIGICLWLLA
jgi:LmbE family N-acetylglucosaminyl deacetylase